MLVKTESLKTLEQNISPVEAVETAIRDQNKIYGISDIARLQMLAIHRQKCAQNVVWLTTTPNGGNSMMETQPQHNACRDNHCK